MISRFGTMQAIAAKRGDGLRPELVELLARLRAQGELGAKSPFPICDYHVPVTKIGTDENATKDSTDVPR